MKYTPYRPRILTRIERQSEFKVDFLRLSPWGFTLLRYSIYWRRETKSVIYLQICGNAIEL